MCGVCARGGWKELPRGQEGSGVGVEGALGLCPEPYPSLGLAGSVGGGLGTWGAGVSLCLGGMGWAPGLSGPHLHPAPACPSLFSLARCHLAALGGSGSVTSSLPASRVPSSLGSSSGLCVPRGEKGGATPPPPPRPEQPAGTLKGRKGWRQRLERIRL